MKQKQSTGTKRKHTKRIKHAVPRRGWGKRMPMRRAYDLFKLLQAGGFPNATTLGKALKVSPKTIIRDIEMLRDTWHVPVAYDASHFGYYLTEPMDRFPGIPMTEREVFALLIATKAAEHYRGTEWETILNGALYKLMDCLDDEERIMFEGLDEAIESRPFGAENADLKIFEEITTAIRKKRAVKFPYRKPGTKVYETREVLPYRLIKANHRWYLIGPYVGSIEINEEFLKKPFPYTLLRKFTLGRMRDPEVMPIKYTVPANFSLEEYLAGAFIIMTGTGDHHVEIETNAWLTDILGDRHLHQSQKWTYNEDGSGLLSLRLSCLDEIEQFVLSWGTDLTVRGPQELINNIYKKVSALEQRYRSMVKPLKSENAEMQQSTVQSPQSTAVLPGFADGI